MFDVYIPSLLSSPHRHTLSAYEKFQFAYPYGSGQQHAILESDFVYALCYVHAWPTKSFPQYTSVNLLPMKYDC